MTVLGGHLLLLLGALDAVEAVSRDFGTAIGGGSGEA